MLIRTKSDFVASGTVSKVAIKTFGANKYPKLEFTLKYDYDKETKKGLFINCACLFEDAKRWKHLDAVKEVMVCGKYEQRTYTKDGEQKTADDYIVTFISPVLQFAVEEEQPEEVSEDKCASNETLPF